MGFYITLPDPNMNDSVKRAATERDAGGECLGVEPKRKISHRANLGRLAIKKTKQEKTNGHS